LLPQCYTVPWPCPKSIKESERERERERDETKKTFGSLKRNKKEKNRDVFGINGKKLLLLSLSLSLREPYH
jgi:hypothetical protein